MKIRALAIIAAILMVPISASVEKIVYQTAKVSWYGPGFHGRLMANGKRFDMNNPFLVAHKTLPFGTLIEFKHNDKVAMAVVTDRGPYIKGREFDLSKGLAQKLGVSGVAVVSYRIIPDDEEGSI